VQEIQTTAPQKQSSLSPAVDMRGRMLMMMGRLSVLLLLLTTAVQGFTSLSEVTVLVANTNRPSSNIPFSKCWTRRENLHSHHHHHHHQESTSCLLRRLGIMCAATKDQEGTTNEDKGGGGLVAQSAIKSQLFSAFTNLAVTDQYDAVLTGLAAKILDAENDVMTPERTVSELASCYELLTEMNQKRIAPSPRSTMAMIDVRCCCYVCVCAQQRKRICRRISNCIGGNDKILTL
jgi:hypothetical protein